ncbi:hypothetical protein CAEBREN_19890 [Caenorhabditis brenneri]|uniref:Uncharacterized protein n=1 Tax=Caenorhabditis brenneri TaxID=135651 RepID=G0NWE4_CAEBE|nr:hypothetical protein CAEBREN_19890 [Caenorhabditis brenneri]
MGLIPLEKTLEAIKVIGNATKYPRKLRNVKILDTEHVRMEAVALEKNSKPSPKSDTDLFLDLPLKIHKQNVPSQADEFKARLNQVVVVDKLPLPPNRIELITVNASNREAERLREQLKNSDRTDDRRETEISSRIRENNALQLQVYNREVANLEAEKKHQTALREAEMAEIERKTEEDIQNALERQQREQRKRINESKQRREDYERETLRLQEESLKELRQRSDAIAQCLLLKYRFETKEKEWSDWLHVVSRSVGRAKHRFSEFELEVGDIFNGKISRSKMNFIMEEAIRLHGQTYSAYNTLFGACNEVKKLVSSYPEKSFLRNLQSNLVTVSNKLYFALIAIDNFVKDKKSIECVREEFYRINPSDVIETWKLRALDLQPNNESFEMVDDPLEYDNSAINIEEVLEDLELESNTSVLKESHF